MSVEEAREALLMSASNWVRPYAVIDRLILEVQTEMPCSDGGDCFEADPLIVYDPPKCGKWHDCVELRARHPAKNAKYPYPSMCPSCLAREKLKQLTDGH